MKSSRIISFVIVAFALVILLGQSVGVGAQPNPPHAKSISFTTGSGVSAHVDSQSPFKVTVQGRLTNASGQPVTSGVAMTFKLYDSGNNVVFSEGPVSVTPNNLGLLTYQIGSATTITSGQVADFAYPLSLGVTIGNDPEMSPHILLTAAPYAMSLAPGAVISGTIANPGLGRFGVLNALNADHSANAGAGLYAEGNVAVAGISSSSNSDGATAGEFINQGGGSGFQQGIEVINSSTGGAYGYGATITNLGGGNANQFGMTVQNTTAGGQQGYGLSVNNDGSSGGAEQYGITAQNDANPNTAGYAGYFNNVANSGGNGKMYGIYAETSDISNVSSAAGYFNSRANGIGSNYGVVGVSDATINSYGGVFTATDKGVMGFAGANPPAATNFSDGVTGLSADTSGNGVFGHATGANGYGVWGSAINGSASAVGGWFSSYDSGAAHLGLRVVGTGHATGGFSTGLDYGMMVRYDGVDELHPGDVLVADGNNTTLDGVQILGTAKANADNLGAAIGVAQYRYNVYPVSAKDKAAGKDDGLQVDDTATSFKQGDLMQIVIIGQAQMKVGGKSNIGDELTIGKDGSAAVASDSARHTIGKVVSAPDSDGVVTVFVNFK